MTDPAFTAPAQCLWYERCAPPVVAGVMILLGFFPFFERVENLVVDQRILAAAQADKLTSGLKIVALPARIELYFSRGLSLQAGIRDTGIYLKTLRSKFLPNRPSFLKPSKKNRNRPMPRFSLS